EAFLWQAAVRGNVEALVRLAEMRERAGDREGAEAFSRQAAAHSASASAVARLAMDLESFDFKALSRRAADQTEAVFQQAADQGNVEAVFKQAADQGNVGALVRLAEMRERAGDREGTEALVRQAANQSRDITDVYSQLTMLELLNKLWPNGLDPDGTPTPPWQP
ncbi:hypothetical protein ACFU93_21125, partial [Streptomyces sp. NPDC057611]